MSNISAVPIIYFNMRMAEEITDMDVQQTEENTTDK